MAIGDLCEETSKQNTLIIMDKHVPLFIIFFILSNLFVSSQERLYVEKTFRTTALYHQQTTETTPTGGFTLLVEHVFGKTDITSNEFINDFMGLDLSANIRFGFEIPVNQRFFLTIGRTRQNKMLDLSAKYLLLRQTEDNAMPISLAIFSQIYSMTDKFPSATGLFNSDGSAFTYGLNHRFSYFNQLIIARKINNSLSLQLSPCIIYKNIVQIDEANFKTAIPAGVRLKTGLTSSVLFEYTHIIDKKGNQTMPLGVAYEIQTASHVFQIGISNTNQLAKPTFYYNDNLDISKGQLMLGFNLHKTFYLNKKS